MQNIFNNLKKNPIINLISIFIIISYFFGFYLNENSSGGALQDFKIHWQTLSYFEESYINSLNNYEKLGNTHSPVYIIFLELLNIKNNMFYLRFVYIFICILLPFYFYKCLRLKFPLIDKKILFYLSLFFFLSPYFRSLAYWPGDENLGLIFFTISIFYFLKFNKKENKETKYLILNIFFLACSAYIRPIYCLFSIYFFTK